MAAEPLLSVILPAHNEVENIPKMARRLAEVLTAAHIRYEVLFVNDGSTDNSWDVIRQTAQAYPQVRASGSPALSARRQPCTPGCRPPVAIAAPRWTVTCSTPWKRSPKCTGSGPRH